MDDELLTTQEVADYFKVTVQCVQKWIRAGLLPAFQFREGSPYRVSKKAVMEKVNQAAA